MFIGVGVNEKKKTEKHSVSILFHTTIIALLQNNRTKRKNCLPSYSPFFLIIKFSLIILPLPLPPLIQNTISLLNKKIIFDGYLCFK